MVNIRLNIDPEVQITQLQDITINATTPVSADQTGNTDACVYSNADSNKYSVTVSGSGAGSAFTVTDGATPIAYTADWTDAASTTTALTATTKLENQAGSADATCTDAKLSNFKVTFAQSAVNAAASGSYLGTATVLVQPY